MATSASIIYLSLRVSPVEHRAGALLPCASGAPGMFRWAGRALRGAPGPLAVVAGCFSVNRLKNCDPRPGGPVLLLHGPPAVHVSAGPSQASSGARVSCSFAVYLCTVGSMDMAAL